MTTRPRAATPRSGAVRAATKNTLSVTASPRPVVFAAANRRSWCAETPPCDTDAARPSEHRRAAW